MKELPNASKPHVVTFLRTSREETSVSFSLMDSSSVPKTIVPQTSVTFKAFNVTSRRLEQTSAPARRARGGHGGGRGGGRGGAGGRSSRGGFAGHSPGKGMRGAQGYLPGGRTRTGKSAAGHFSNPRNAHFGVYGYRKHQLGNNFPRGFATTHYGISGPSAYRRHNRMVVASWLGGAYFFSRFSSMCGCAFGMACRQCHVSHDDADGSDYAEWTLEEDLNREDITTTGFIPNDYTYPLLLTVTAVSGKDYNQSRMCPPAGWDSSGSSKAASGKAAPVWTPPARPDLFFTVTELEDLAAEDPSETLPLIGVLVTVFLVVISIYLVRYCADKASQKKNSKFESTLAAHGKEKRTVQLPSFKRRYEPCPIALGTQQARDVQAQPEVLAPL